ncbi:MAG: threonine ammonia-lyase [Gemmatimonadota bacterium]|nr:threonine ammonia-lyase [Gemmatimonadota bacterium]MDE2984009.1 threonine ammonia-lyase [Gemmatimonadota bacterium]
MLTAAEVVAARDRIGSHVVTTGCPESFALRGVTGCPTYLKAELRQQTGSFKDRGSLNKLMQLGDAERDAGVVAASAGNHAQALARHAARLGIPCTIVMPNNAPLIKVSNTRASGARVIQTGDTLSDGMAVVDRLVTVERLTLVHAFDDLAVMAGQGTMGLEILEQVPEVSVIVVPVGGGGMISGVATAVKAAKPGVRVVGVEAEASPGAVKSLEAGAPAHVEMSDTLADGIAVKRIGDLTWPHLEALADDVVLVSEEEIIRAIFFLLEREKLVVEGAGAVGVAALLEGKIRLGAGDSIVCILSGGNIDMNMVSRIIDRGLWADGRLASLSVVVRDRPGYLNEVTGVVAIAGANVLHIEHTRAFGDIAVGKVGIEMKIETRGREHVAEIVAQLRELGHRVDEVG